MRQGAITGLLLRAGAVAIAAIFLIAYRQYAFSGAPQVSIAASAAKSVTPQEEPSSTFTSSAALSSPPGLPLPDVYGVYAINNGQLYELEALPGRVPDQRVFMSTAIKTPSHTTVSDGHVAFVIYRRDIASSAPDRGQVRVIAKVMRAITFSAAGRVDTMPVGDQWTIRSNSFEFRVAPVNENAEMLVMRPANPDFVLPAGRYGLVLKGQAYDLTVDGPVTDSAQCLERVEAANGAFFSECRNP